MPINKGGVKASSFSYALHQLPKVELHCHLTGTVSPETWYELARKNGVSLPGDPALIFSRINSGWPIEPLYENTRIPMGRGNPAEAGDAIPLALVFEWILACLRDREDFERIGYECARDAFRKSNIRYQEVFFGLTHLLGRRELTYCDIMDGLLDGCRRAEKEFGIRTRIICGISRHKPAEVGMEIVDLMIANPRDDIIGIGLDGYELAGAPELYADVFRKAKAHGLKATAHSSEHSPSAKNTLTCLDVLKCDRIDHGYFVLEDDEAVKRCRGDGVHFTCACTTSRIPWRSWRRASIAKMVDEGLNVTLCSDDPAMFPTTLSREYAIAHEELGLGPEAMRNLWLTPIEASWLDDGGKRDLRAQFNSEAERLKAFENTEPAGETVSA